MNEILIYKAESDVKGLAEKVRSSLSVAYNVPMTPWAPDPTLAKKIVANIGRTDAGAHDSDLYYTKSILVTTNWNKNDDVFGSLPVWMARHTPAHKPTNLEHDERALVGHMTDNWAITTDGTLIPDDTAVEDLPEVYHIVNGAVIYARWSEQDLIDRTNKLIEEIEAGTKYVSMECLFSDFDYAVLKDGVFSVVARTEDTAFLTKHLRSYGGVGEYEGQKLGRYLKNITFSGKGYTDRPANPNSIIFNDANMFNYVQASEPVENTFIPHIENNGVSINCGHNIVTADKNCKEKHMSGENILQEQNAELKNRVSQLEASLAETSEKLAKADVAQYETRITELEHDLEAAQALVDELTQAKDTTAKDLAEVEARYEELEAAKAELETKLAEIVEAKCKSDRVAILMDGDIDKDVAETKVELYANLNDEQFQDIASELIAAVSANQETPPVETPDTDESTDADTSTDDSGDEDESTDAGDESDDDSDDADANANDEVLEDVETDEETPDLSVASDDVVDEAKDLRTELSQAIGSGFLGIKLENSDEDSDE
jgi:hypothetical protein